MSARAIREATGKDLLNRFLPDGSFAKCKFATVADETSWNELVETESWLSTGSRNVITGIYNLHLYHKGKLELLLKSRDYGLLARLTALSPTLKVKELDVA
ncbi:hypothetical protein QYM36_007782 [Artemia franciscana]|uniref:Uncharacterized protein n=1 Tax=Artemia franciscana TaxID=6661 RepID=A0AA88IHL8_ARTSF|nr:hypothetical protein QYM36_007782 [Artemia franciscana]